LREPETVIWNGLESVVRLRWRSGSPVVAGTKKGEAADVATEASDANARAAENPSHTQPPAAVKAGEVQLFPSPPTVYPHICEF